MKKKRNGDGGREGKHCIRKVFLVCLSRRREKEKGWLVAYL